MGHRTVAPHRLTVLYSSQETTVVCSTCHSTVKTLLTTPYGKLCPGCFKSVHEIQEPEQSPLNTQHTHHSTNNPVPPSYKTLTRAS